MAFFRGCSEKINKNFRPITVAAPHRTLTGFPVSSLTVFFREAPRTAQGVLSRIEGIRQGHPQQEAIQSIHSLESISIAISNFP